jgi:hypothetical protein
MMALTPDTWRIIGYVRDIVVILGIALGALYLSGTPRSSTPSCIGLSVTGIGTRLPDHNQSGDGPLFLRRPVC